MKYILTVTLALFLASHAHAMDNNNNTQSTSVDLDDMQSLLWSDAQRQHAKNQLAALIQERNEFASKGILTFHHDTVIALAKWGLKCDDDIRAGLDEMKQSRELFETLFNVQNQASSSSSKALEDN